MKHIAEKHIVEKTYIGEINILKETHINMVFLNFTYYFYTN